MKAARLLATTSSTDEAQSSKGQIIQEQRKDGEEDAVLDHTRAPENADTGSHRPERQDNVDGYPGNHWQPQSTENRCDDEREERVADDADGLEERTAAC